MLKDQKTIFEREMEEIAEKLEGLDKTSEEYKELLDRYSKLEHMLIDAHKLDNEAYEARENAKDAKSRKWVELAKSGLMILGAAGITLLSGWVGNYSFPEREGSALANKLFPLK